MKPYIPALIFLAIILGCFLLGAFIDKYLRMRAIREFAKRYREADRLSKPMVAKPVLPPKDTVIWITDDGKIIERTIDESWAYLASDNPKEKML